MSSSSEQKGRAEKIPDLPLSELVLGVSLVSNQVADRKVGFPRFYEMEMIKLLLNLFREADIALLESRVELIVGG
jgi:hypothetical protein